MNFLLNMISKFIGPSDKTVEKIKPWVIWGFICLVLLTMFIYLIGGMFFFKAGRGGFWSLPSSSAANKYTSPCLSGSSPSITSGGGSSLSGSSPSITSGGGSSLSGSSPSITSGGGSVISSFYGNEV